MRQLATLLCLSVLMSACGSKPGEPGAPTNPSTVPSPPTPPTPTSSPTLITVGEEVTGVLEAPSDSYVYEVIAPSNGTLTARVSWEPTQDGSPVLSVADSVFASDSSPVVGSLPVSAGQKYRVTVADGAPWDYGALHVQFRLTTSME